MVPRSLVELRIGGGNKGAQTMAPPSRHPEGEWLRWDQDGEPTEVEGAALKKVVAQLAAAALLVRHYPGEGSRHEAALVLGGLLARGRGTAEDISYFVERIASAAGDEEAAERGASAAGAVVLLEQGRECPGLPRMREVWGTAVADTVAKWLAIPSTGQAGVGLILPAGVPTAAADKFVEHHHLRENIPLLRHYRGAFYRWTGTHYHLYRDESLERDLYSFLKGASAINQRGNVAPYNPTKQKVQEVIHALRRSALLLPEEWEAPFWLPAPGQESVYRPAVDLIACGNGILALGTRELLPHNPLFFTSNCLPFDYDANAPEPDRWYQFLEEVWPSDSDGNWDKEAVRTLREIFGYLLAHDTRQQKIFLIVGPKRGGKGTIVSVLEQLLGPDNIVFQTLNSLTGEFGRWPLIDKKLSVFADARLSSRGNISRLVETLLSISGGDPQTINRKHGSFWNGRLGVRFVITTNVLPALADASGTIASRFIMLKLTQSFYGREDTALQAALLRELPGILNWALVGLARLRKRGHFRQPASSKQAIELLEHLAAPVGAFVDDWCRIAPEARMNVKTLYRAYKEWSTEAGLRTLPAHMFGKELRDVVVPLDTSGHGKKRAYVGVTLTDEGLAQWEELEAEKGRTNSRTGAMKMLKRSGEHPIMPIIWACLSSKKHSKDKILIGV